jgi:DNA modification methylase
MICGGKSVSIPRKMKGCPKCGSKERMIICRVCNKEVHSHYAMFPERLVEMLMMSATKEGDEVLDPFSGFGTVISVAIKYNRRATGIDVNPLNTAMAFRRGEESLLNK